MVEGAFSIHSLLNIDFDLPSSDLMNVDKIFPQK